MVPRRFCQLVVLIGTVVLLGLVVGCTWSTPGRIERLQVVNGGTTLVTTTPRIVRLAGGETDGVLLRPDERTRQLSVESAGPVEVTLYEVVEASIDRRDPAVVRRTGRADGVVDMPIGLVALDARGTFPATAAAWVDITLPRGTTRQQVVTVVALDVGGKEVARHNVIVQPRGLDLPDDMPLAMAGRVTWAELTAAWPEAFASATPTTIGRDIASHRAAVEVLDAMMARNLPPGVEVAVEGLRPRFPAALSGAATTDWQRYDALIGPWLDGAVAFPMPRPGDLWRYGSERRARIWQGVLAHFSERQWLDHATLTLEGSDVSRAFADPNTPGLSSALAREVDAVLTIATRARVLLDAPAATFDDLPPNAMPRAARLVEVSRHDPRRLATWLAIDARETDTAAWLAAERGARVALVRGIIEPGDADAWFHNGRSIGRGEPVVIGFGLIRARRASFDAAYAAAAATVDANATAAIVDAFVRPIVVPTVHASVAVVDLLAGPQTHDAAAAREQLAVIAQGSSGNAVATVVADPTPRMMRLRWDLVQESIASGSTRLDDRRLILRADAIARQASPPEPEGLRLILDKLPAGWQADPPSMPTSPPPLGHAVVLSATGSVAVDDLRGAGPASLRMQNLHDASQHATEVAAPASRLVPLLRPVTIDGTLGDWSYEAAVHRGPLVPLASRIEAATIGPAADVLAGVTSDSLVLAFKTDALADNPASAGVTRTLGRVTGEDAVEFVLRPVRYTAGDSRPGPATRVIVKPNGVAFVERLVDVGQLWRPVAIRLDYATTLGDDGVWRGELRLPFIELLPPEPGRRINLDRPGLILFNATRYDASTGNAGSWAGPTDEPGEADLLGALILPSGEIEMFR